MATKTKSCFTFLREALILPTRNPKLFTPVLLLLAGTAFLGPVVQVVFVQPLAYDMMIHFVEMGNMDPSSPEYAKILEEIKQDAVKLVLIVIAQLIVTLALAFLNQIIAFFAASTTYSGSRYSLAELIHEIRKGSTLKGPFITLAVVTTLNFAWMAVLTALLSAVMRGGGMLSVEGLAFALTFLAFMYFTVVALVGVAASVVDEEYRGVGALRQAWRLMTRVKRKEGLVLVLVTHLLPTVVTPLYGVVALLYAKSMAAALCMLAVYGFLSGAVQVYYLAAATVYYYEAMDSKEEAPCGYAKIPSGEGNV
ncbi:uncharacterized protein LOC124655217 [Lolium rigidum]|uniref:uncharacterized protein LOC124655217 n=1 Tax=Lolium rigidum TaxID=89674 RepID=UPI001F5D0A65|nr:uncharacterized protein LOC124655217 [Lolium rigidum]